MIIRNLPLLKILGRIADKADTGRYALDHIHFDTMRNIIITDGFVLAIIKDGWIKESNDLDEIWLKIKSNTMKETSFTRINDGYDISVLSIKSEVSWPSIIQLLPDYTDLKPAVNMAVHESNYQVLLQKFGKKNSLWYADEKKSRVSILYHGIPDLYIFQMNCLNEETFNTHDLLKPYHTLRESLNNGAFKNK